MRTEEIPEIAALPLFAAMNERMREEIFRASFLQVFPPALTLIETGGRADFLHVLLDGLVELFTTNGSCEVTMQLVRPVSSFILAAAYTDQRYLMSARTLSASRILMIPSPLLRTTIAKDGALAAAAMTEIALRYPQFGALADGYQAQADSRKAGQFPVSGKPAAGRYRAIPAARRKARDCFVAGHDT